MLFGAWVRADRRDKLLKWLDTEGQNCTPNNTLTAGRVENLYDLMDAAYDSIEI